MRILQGTARLNHRSLLTNVTQKVLAEEVQHDRGLTTGDCANWSFWPRDIRVGN